MCSTVGSVVACAVLATAVPAAAQTKTFSGAYAGLDLGRQSIIGGSLVGGVDVLSQDDRAVVGVFGGARYQIGTVAVLGIEASVGFMDGDLRQTGTGDLSVDYRNNTQTMIGIQGGVVLGGAREWLVFGYLSEATRTFDVTITQNGETFTQQDEQGMLRYGIGVERRLHRIFHLRATVGSGRADFGDRQTNIDAERRVEFATGLLIQI